MTDAPIDNIKQSASLSVMSWRNRWYGMGMAQPEFGEYGYSLPTLYNPLRQAILSRIALHPQNSMWQGAVSGVVTHVAGTSWEIKGKRRVTHYQDILLNANFGAGWEAFLGALLWDYINCDDGAVMEIIGRGEPDTPLKRELVTGIAALDVGRCYFTGDWEFPIYYQNAETGKLHKLHHTRVYRFVSMPLSDPELRGRGLSPLSRAFGYVQQAITQMTYIGEKMNDAPPPGILTVNGVRQEQWEDAWRKYTAARTRANTNQYPPVVQYINESNEPVTIEFVAFSSEPANWDAEKQERLQALGMARGLGIDPQDISPISGGNFGTNTQAKVLDKKGSSKLYLILYKMLERAFNTHVLPDALRFSFKSRDADQSLQDAEIANLHLDAAAKLNTLAGTPSDTGARYAAATVPAVADILLDEDGQLVQVYDDDVEEPTPKPALDAAPSANDTDTAPADGGDVTLTDAQKDYEDTRLRFTDSIYSIIAEANDGNIANRRRAGTLLRSVIARDGRRAMLDGLAAGGVEVETLDDTDEARYKQLVSSNSAYVSKLTARIWASDTPLSEAQLRNSAEAWANKTLQQFYDEGLLSSDKNGLYEFYGSDGAESCRDCTRLKGKKFRLSDWMRSGYLPSDPNTKLACGGFRCEHKIRATTGRANSKRMIGL